MTVSVNLSHDAELRLARLAEATGHSKDWHIQRMIEEGLQEIDDEARADIVLSRIRNGDEKIHSAKAVRAELGLDD
jgi:RHH-type transcriptional regulator, rel operon repressor / antitoxin RelB